MSAIREDGGEEETYVKSMTGAVTFVHAKFITPKVMSSIRPHWRGSVHEVLSGSDVKVDFLIEAILRG